MCSHNLTRFGEQVASGSSTGEMQSHRGGRILSIKLFDGVGCLRVALDLLGCNGARRVVEHHFPGTVHYPDIVEVKEKDVVSRSLMYGQVEMVILEHYGMKDLVCSLMSSACRR